MVSEAKAKGEAFKNQSTIVRIVVLPSEGGRPVMKSNAIAESVVGRGDPQGQWTVFPQAQTEQAVTNSLEGHQKHCLRRERVRANPG